MFNIKSILGAIIFTSFGAFIGMILTIESGLYDAYYTDRLEVMSGKEYYTSTECKALFNKGVLEIDENGLVTEESKEKTRKEKRKAERFREYLEKEYGD